MKSDKRPKPETPVDLRLVDRLILLATNGATESDLQTAATKLAIAPEAAAAHIAEAKRRLTLAANYNRDEQLAIAITRLHECYAQSRGIQDIKTCVACQREINKLTQLYALPTADKTDDDAEPPDQAAARAHLAPLFPDAGAAPLAELCRRAAGEILSRVKPPAETP